MLRDMPIFAVLLQKVLLFRTKCYQNCTRCREIHSIEPFEIGFATLQSVSEWQRDKVDWSGKNADFSTLVGCHGNVPQKIKKLNK